VSPKDESRIVYISKAYDILEALINLTYLMCEEAQHPEKVRQYATMCDERLEAMKHLLLTKDID
jgi:hypothetical protein